MINSIFFLLNFLDTNIFGFIPLFIRIVIWGIIAGVLAIILYKVSSNQTKIKELSKEIKTIQKRLLKEDNEDSEFISLSLKNLKYSFKLVLMSFIPAFLSTIPVLILMFYVQAYHSYTFTGSDKGILVTTTPQIDNLKVKPESIRVKTSPDTIKIIPSKKVSQITFSLDKHPIFKGDVFSPPVSVIEKKQWWNVIIENTAGYISDEATISQIDIHFPRKQLYKNITNWASGWELTFFIAVFVSTLLGKILLKVK